MKESDDFPQGDKTLRKEDHQAFLREFIFTIGGGTYHLQQVVDKDKTSFRRPASSPRLSASLQKQPLGAHATDVRLGLLGDQPGSLVGPYPQDRKLSVRFGGLAALSTSISNSIATKSAPLSVRTAPAKARSSIA